MTDTTVNRGSAGQTYLVGETLYLRGLELKDAKRASAWRDSPFPISAERAEEILKKDVPADSGKYRYHLVACRLSDDEPVGAATYQTWNWRTMDLSVHADPILGPAAAVKAEILRLTVPWLLIEREKMVVWVDLADDEPLVEEAAMAIGMRLAVRLREAFWRDGRRADALIYEALHPAAVERLGTDTIPAGAETQQRGVAQPTIRPLVVGNPPRNAMMVGPRVYLRPMEVEDAEPRALWSRRETETFFDSGRHIHSPISLAHNIREAGESDPPSDISFAIALRESDALIGAVELMDLSWIHKTAETGSVIYRPEYRGGGYGTEAKHLLLAYAFERLGLHMVRSYVWAPNTRSAAALRKQGYRDAGRLRWTGLKHAEFVDDLVFDLLASEWRTAEAAGAGLFSNMSTQPTQG